VNVVLSLALKISLSPDGVTAAVQKTLLVLFGSHIATANREAELAWSHDLTMLDDLCTRSLNLTGAQVFAEQLSQIVCVPASVVCINF
jgi:hypothetical protein